MKTLKFKTLGVECAREFPSTLAEVREKMGMTDEAIATAVVQKTLHHVFLGDVRENVADALVKDSGIARLKLGTGKFKKDDTEIERDEPAQEYIDRVVESGEITKDDLKEYVTLAVAEVEFKATSPREKKDKDLEERMAMAKLMVEDTERMEKFIKKCAVENIEFDTEDVAEVAEAIKKYRMAI